MNIVFEPKVGLKTDDCYLHGINRNDDILDEGVIEHVGVDYFILRNKNKDIPLFVPEDSYWVIDEKDFS